MQKLELSSIASDFTYLTLSQRQAYIYELHANRGVHIYTLKDYLTNSLNLLASNTNKVAARNVNTLSS